VATYLRGAAASQPRFLASLLGLPAAEVEAALVSLEAEDCLRRDAQIKGLPGQWVVWHGDADRRH
jgi:hypothetical protein